MKRGPRLRPEIVFFDVGDTLIRADPSWAEIYLRVCRSFGLEVGLDELARVLASVPWDVGGAFEPTEQGAYERIKAFDQGVLAALGHEELPETFFRALSEAFADRDSWFVFPDVAPALDALAGAGIRRAVISNWTWGAQELLHDLELATRFEALVISARVGYQKPDRGIFEHAVEVTGAPASRALHVGDSYVADVLGARSAGITPVLIDRRITDPARAGVRDVPEADDVAVVQDLYQLLDLLDVPRPALSARG